MLVRTRLMSGSLNWAVRNSSGENSPSNATVGVDTVARATVSSAGIIPHCLHGIRDIASAFLWRIPG